MSVSSTTQFATGFLRLLAPVAVAAAMLLGCQQGRRSPIPYALQTDDARGLRKAAPVYIAGVQVGQVQGVALDRRKAKIHLALDKKLDLLPQGTCARIASYGPGEPVHVALELPEGGQPLPEGSLITCVTSLGSNDAQVTMILGSLTAIFDAAAKKKGVVGRLLHDERLANRFERWLGAAFAEPAKDDAKPAKAPEPEPDVNEVTELAPPPALAPAPKPMPKSAVDDSP